MSPESIGLMFMFIGGVIAWFYCRKVEPVSEAHKDQGPFTVVTFAEDGTYKVRVLPSLRNLVEQIQRSPDYEHKELPYWSFYSCPALKGVWKMQGSDNVPEQSWRASLDVLRKGWD